MKRLILILIFLALGYPVSARGFYYNNTIYNTDKIIKVVKHSNSIATVLYINKQQETIRFKNNSELKRFFDAVQVVIL